MKGTKTVIVLNFRHMSAQEIGKWSEDFLEVLDSSLFDDFMYSFPFY